MSDTVKLNTYGNGKVGDIDIMADCSFEVSKEWAETRAREWGFPSFDEFLNEYTYDDTYLWPKEALQAGELISMSIHNVRPEEEK